ncbi:MAG: glycoside hydrolase, partial [Segetibacter sp.]|nr:glycoside hydrolase [Segetibacter sp.]
MEAIHPNYSTSKSKEEVFAEDNFINPLPRAVVRPNAPVLLDGEWNFSLDNEDIGLLESWHLGHEYNDKAHWPGSIEEHIAA